MATGNTSQKPHKKAVGGFAIGDFVEVVAPKSTYLGKNGTISGFCKNPDAKQIYVQLDGETEVRLNKGSLKKVEGPDSVHSRTDSTGVPSHVMKDSTHTHDSGYGRRVMTLFEYVGEIKKEYSTDKNLTDKLYEIEKMIMGLSLDT